MTHPDNTTRGPKLSMFALTFGPTLTSGLSTVNLCGHPVWLGISWTSVQRLFVNVQMKMNRADPGWKYAAFEVCLW